MLFRSPPASYDDFPPFRPPPPLPADLSAGGPPPVGGVPFSEAAARARDIAQRLGKLAGLQPPPPPPAPVVNDECVLYPCLPASDKLMQECRPDNRPFAERMMSKFGWKEGRGLGADESGMTAALTVSKPSGPPKKGKEKNAKDAPPVSAPTGMAVGAKGRGSIVDASREGRVASQTKELGEPSRVVLLTNLCGRDDVDDDLGGEVAEEANKFGVVDRCFVYLVPGEERDDETVRIFLVMSGCVLFPSSAMFADSVLRVDSLEGTMRFANSKGGSSVDGLSRPGTLTVLCLVLSQLADSLLHQVLRRRALQRWGASAVIIFAFIGISASANST